MSGRLLTLAVLVASCAGPLVARGADVPFFQALQAPAAPSVAAYPGSPPGPEPDLVGTPLPPIIETDAPVTTYGSAAYAPGMVHSTTIDQQAIGMPGMQGNAPGSDALGSNALGSNAPGSNAPGSNAPGSGAPIPLDVFDPDTWFVSDPSFIPPWQLGPAQCRDCRTNGMVLFHNYSSWRGISEGTGSNNNGLSYGINYGTKLGAFSDITGIGFQIGGSYGLYDLNGRSSGFRDKEIQQQGFLTVGFFRPSDRYTNFSFGVVYDAMWNTNFGQYAVSPYLSQVRAQIGYALNPQHEIGFWAAIRTNTATAEAAGQQLAYRGVDQFTLYYHHRFVFGADGVTWFGLPDHTKLGGSGSLGEYTFGGTLTAPLSPRFAAYTSMQYMAPSSRSGAAGAIEETFFISLGLSFYPWANSRAANVAGDCWMPYMPVATDGTFLVDTNKTF